MVLLGVVLVVLVVLVMLVLVLIPPTSPPKKIILSETGRMGVSEISV